MQTTANRTVANSLPKNEVIFLTLLISKKYIPGTNLRKKLYAGTCHILKSGYIFFGIAYISVSSIILIAWNA